MNILAGYEIGSGSPVQIPVAHMAITGQTQRSGKTTALEALVERTGMRAVAFVTKRKESAFQYGHEIPPYFRDRADWKFVKELFEQLTGYAQNDKEAEIIRLCDGARSLEQVAERTTKKLEGKHSKRKDDMYVRMNAYFAEIIPQLEKIPRSKRMEIKRGVNVIDIREYDHGVQELLIQNVFEWVYQHEENTIFIVPEAWDFLGEEHGSITRTAGREFIRRAAASHNFLWADCQDIRGLDKVILGQMGVWLVGNQREMNEVARTIKSFVSLPEPPSATEIMTLGIGEFFVLYGTESRKVFVQALWADAHACAVYAKNRAADGAPKMPIPRMPPPPKRQAAQITLEEQAHEDAKEIAEHEETHAEPAVQQSVPDGGARSVDVGGHQDGATNGQARRTGIHAQEESSALRGEIETLRQEVRALAQAISFYLEKGTQMPKQQVTGANTAVAQAAIPSARPARSGLTEADYDEGLYQWIKRRAMQDPELLTLLVSKPELRIKVERPVLEVNGNSLRGALGLLITKGFFKAPVTASAAYSELVRIGRRVAKPGVYAECDKLAELGFLTKEEGGYQSVADMKVHVHEDVHSERRN
jgi:hypothetical protein